MQANFKGFTFVDESSIDDHFEGRDLEPMDEDVEWDDHYRHSQDGGSASRSPDMHRMSGVMHDEGGMFGNGGMEI